jgi:hypothetical protein
MLKLLPPFESGVGAAITPPDLLTRVLIRLPGGIANRTRNGTCGLGRRCTRFGKRYGIKIGEPSRALLNPLGRTADGFRAFDLDRTRLAAGHIVES